MICVKQLLIGKIAPLGTHAVLSGIDKHPVAGRLWLDHEGFVGDAQGDRKHHGGPEKAVHHYAFEHYQYWQTALGTLDVLAQPGAFGENISTTGLNESNVAIGDSFRVGSAVIQVSQGRQPCWKLNARFGVRDMAALVQRNGRTGWYYRVLEPGFVESGDELIPIARLSPQWTIERLWHALYVDTLNLNELSAMAELEHLAENWRRHAQKRLCTRRVEDWSRRLTEEETG
jgi:MOSC domain-containing protein YiiM